MNQIQIPRTFLLSLTLVFVIIIAGCVGGPQRGLFNIGQDALKISVDTEGRDTFDSLQPFTITVTAENTGLFNVENVASRLQGYDGLTAQSPNVQLSAEKRISPSTLDRPDAEKNIPGGTGTVDWDVYAPFVGAAEPDREITLTAEVLYDTKSLATQRVVAATRDYITQAQARGEQVPTMPETESLNGPIAVDVEIPSPYIKVLGDQRTDFRAKLSFNNDGSGTLLNRDNSQTDYLTNVILRVPPGIGFDATNCDLVPIGSTSDVSVERSLVVDMKNNPEKLRLLEGGLTRDLNCHLYVDKDYVSGYNTFDLKVESDYTYIQDVQHQLTIKGTEEKPLRLSILSPTAGSPENWIRNTIHSVKFLLLFQNVPITTGLSAKDLTVTIGNKPAQAIDLKYDNTEKAWVMRVRTPDLGTQRAPYDLNVDAKYGADATSATQKNAIEYAPVPLPSG